MYVISWRVRHFRIYFEDIIYKNPQNMSDADYEIAPTTIHRTVILHEARLYGTMEKAKHELVEVLGNDRGAEIIEINDKDLFKSKLEYGKA